MHPSTSNTPAPIEDAPLEVPAPVRIVQPDAERPEEMIAKKMKAKLQEDVLEMPIQEIEAFIPQWKSQRRFYSTTFLTADYQRGTITRSILCEFLHWKGVLMTTTPEQFMDRKYVYRDTCYYLMEITSWTIAANLMNYSDYATEDLLWGQKLERERPGTFDRLLRDRRRMWNSRTNRTN